MTCLSLITQKIAALQEQRHPSAAFIDSTVEESSPPKQKAKEDNEPLGIINLEEAPKGEFVHEERQFIDSFSARSPVNETSNASNLSPLEFEDQDISFGLQLGEPHHKRPKLSSSRENLG